MGPGKDLDLLLGRGYRATGSDRSETFLEMYRAARGEGADVELLDAVTIETDRRFDAVYTNKVLHHLTEEQLDASLARQWEVTNPGGFGVHTFWHSEKEPEVMFGSLLFTYYTKETIVKKITETGKWAVVEATVYKEMEDDDSVCVVLRRVD
ncbi:unnamed protein product [Ostreobium quekettii]|uniref:Methyltransferase domain-containing protein n=1 Tax=Ostreobium quekettii TaxID=121088 RepID=A0A8S1J9H9_9CHLO|nr:unnamed protein product [Ostreobium quekettii]